MLLIYIYFLNYNVQPLPLKARPILWEINTEIKYSRGEDDGQGQLRVVVFLRVYLPKAGSQTTSSTPPLLCHLLSYQRQHLPACVLPEAVINNKRPDNTLPHFKKQALCTYRIITHFTTTTTTTRWQVASGGRWQAAAGGSGSGGRW